MVSETTNYGEASYWDKRYGEEFSEPFDWLCDYAQLRGAIRRLVPLPAAGPGVKPILAIGCGSAMFSRDMFEDGYSNLINADISEVVIKQQRDRFPDMDWRVLDCLSLAALRGAGLGGGAVAAVVDKSLVDTILCARDSLVQIDRLLSCMYDALAPGGAYVTLSLHKPADVINYFIKDKFNWRVACYNIRNPRWVSEREFRGSCAHTLIVCCKGGGGGRGEGQQKEGDEAAALPPPETVLLEPADGVLGEEEYELLCAEAEELNEERIFRKVTVEELKSCLLSALDACMDFPDPQTSPPSSYSSSSSWSYSCGVDEGEEVAT